MDMIERVARAIAVNFGVDPDGPHFTLSESTLLAWQQFEGTAKDVLEALRDPTEAMGDACGSIIDKVPSDDLPF